MSAGGGRGRSGGVLLLLGTALVLALAGGPAAAQPTPSDAPGAVRAAGPGTGRAEELYRSNCAGCHGQSGEGSQRGPTLIGVGAASVDYYLQSGRMPLAREDQQSRRSAPSFSQQDIADLVSYVGSLGPGGPPIPSVKPGDLVTGGKIYLQECAACHSAGGKGYTQLGGLVAPSLMDIPPEQVAEAIRIGPLTMPQFSTGALDDEQLDSVVSYVQELQRLNGKGGADIGRIGPVSETLVGFAGLAVLLIVVRLIGKRAP